MTAEELLRAYAAGEREFSNANLARANLAGANLQKVRLAGASLIGATLVGASLEGANLERAALEGATLVKASLAGATLEDATLAKANLAGTILMLANLSGADLSGADLGWTNLVRANLAGANLEGADLGLANLMEANFAGANLERANLERAILEKTNFHDVRLAGARIGNTALISVDVGPLCVAELKHRGPSTVDHRSIALSLRAPRLREFLLATGMPAVLADYMIDCARSLDPKELFSMMQSTFISYGGRDQDFAKRLHEALRTGGVTTFFFPEHAVPGDDLQEMMRRGVNEHDRIIIVCSESSLTRRGVLNELKEAFRREAKDGGNNYVIPVVIDGYLFNVAKDDPMGVAARLSERVAADFRDPTEFDASLAKLLRALRKK